MRGGRDAEVLRRVRTLFGAGRVGDCSDGELLGRFVDHRDEDAFGALVERHGAMVMSVCRGVLRDLDEAQDAFQATFLVLAEKAGTIRRRESAACWLHGVALRVASNARAASARRRRHERRFAERAAVPAVGPVEGGDEAASAIHEEIGRLPERYRRPIVLCHLEGMTHEGAARRLGWPVGTVRSRLARGRDRLRARLARRGLSPAIGSAPIVGTAPIPSALLETTIGAAMRIAAGESMTGGPISAAVIALAKGSSDAMFVTKLKAAAMAIILVGFGATGTVSLARLGPVPVAAPTVRSGPAVWSMANGESPIQDNRPEPAPDLRTLIERVRTPDPIGIRPEALPPTRELAEARVEAAESVFEQLFERLLGPPGSGAYRDCNYVDPILEWAARGLDARLDLAESRDDRVAVLLEEIVRFRALEAICEQFAHAAGSTVATVDVIKVRYQRISIEQELATTLEKWSEKN